MAEVHISLEDLVRAARGGDRDAFAELVRQERGALVMTARALVGDRHAAEDAAQEALVTAWRKLDGLRDLTRFRPWLWTILTRICTRLRRDRPSAGIVDPGRLPARESSENERLDHLAAEVERLPGKFRTVISLCYLAGLSYRQVAETTGLAEKLVKSRLFEARTLLRKRIEESRS